MTSADQIASHGRVGKVSALSIGSFGRLRKRVGIVVVTIYREIMRLTSTITKIMNLDSEID